MTISSVAIVSVASLNGHGSGVLITPDEVLTAAHVIQSNGQVATDTLVAPGYNSGAEPFGQFSIATIHSESAGAATIFQQNDFALIHLSGSAAGAGTMKLAPNFAGGAVHVAGYPGSTTFAQVTTVESVTVASDARGLIGDGLGFGSSGGPAWVTGSDGNQYVAGITLGGGPIGNYLRMTPSVISQIQSWLTQDGEAAAAASLTPGPTVALPTTTDPLGFDKAYYDAQNPDVAASGMDAETHFLTFGWREGRNPNALFNTSYYLAHNPDVAAAGLDPLIHYDLAGWKEGRDPSAIFSTTGYNRANPDVAAAGFNPMIHYLVAGLSEGRKAS